MLLIKLYFSVFDSILAQFFTKNTMNYIAPEELLRLGKEIVLSKSN